MEEKISFKSENQKIIGSLHYQDKTKKHPAVLVLHGFEGNKDRIKEVSISSTLAKEGFVALRFDCVGCGESDGSFEEMCISDQVRDLSNAITYIQGLSFVDSERVSAIGSSLGGRDVILYCSENYDLKSICLVAPAINKKGMWNRIEKEGNLKYYGKDVILKDKFKLSKKLMSEFDTDITYLAEKIKCPVQIIHGTRDEVNFLKDSEKFLSLVKTEKKLVKVEGSDHIFTNKKHLNILVDNVVNWFKNK